MSVSPRISALLGLLVVASAIAFTVWSDVAGLHRVERVSALAQPLDLTAREDRASPTGYIDGQRQLIVPERNEGSFEWIAQTQQMLARREWRIRHIDYENAPAGREVSATSPYRWWLGFVAWADHAMSGRPIGASVERAALIADPLLHGIALVAAAVFVAARFGIFAAALLSLGLASFFPFAAGFLPGAPDHHGLARLFALASVLAGVIAMRKPKRLYRHFVLAGVLGGMGMWIDAPTEVPVLIGIVLGGIGAEWLGRTANPVDESEPVGAAFWRAWAVSGAATVAVAYLVEFYPGHLGEWHLESIHPVYGIAWLGAGELVARMSRWKQRRSRGWTWRDTAVVFLAVAGVAVVPAAMHWSESSEFLAKDLLSVRLTSQPNGVVALTFWSWLSRDGLSPTVVAVLAPLIIIGPAACALLRRTTQMESRAALAVAFGPTLVALGVATRQLSGWGLLDGLLVLLAIASMASVSESVGRGWRWVWIGVMAAGVIPGALQVAPRAAAGKELTLASREAEELIERDLAQWLTHRTGEKGVVIYAPPLETTTLCYYGGLSGIGTFSHDNRAGFGATLTIAGANSIEEVRLLLQERGVRFIVVPSWDPFFDEFGSLYLSKRFANRKSQLIGDLRRWSLPPWIRPLPYQMPEVSGFEGQSILIFEVVDEQGPALAAARLAEYFVETGKLEEAAGAGLALRRFPGDLGALAARAQVENARGDTAGAAQTLQAIRARLAAGGDRFLAWDRRVSLAIVLGQQEQIDLAREQVRRCLAEVNETRLRSLTGGLLYNLQVLSRALELPIADPKLRDLAVNLLPPELRHRL